jgi:hypothetical protein
MHGWCPAKLPDNSAVTDGQPLFTLSATDMKLNAVKKRADADIAKIQLIRLRHARDRHGEEIELMAAISAANSAEQVALNAQKALQMLSVRSPGRGVFFAADASPPKLPKLSFEANTPAGNLTPEKWSSPCQFGRFVPAGTLLGTVIGHERFVVVPLSREQLEKITDGVRVKLLLWGNNQQVVESEVQSIVSTNDITAQLLTPFFELSLNRHADAYSVPSQVTNNSTYNKHRFAALIPLPDHLSPVIGSGVEVAFHLPSKTAFGALRTWVYGNARFFSD